MSVVISNQIVTGQITLDQPLTHARIGYQSVLPNAVITGTVGLTGFPLSNLKNPATYERYRPSSIPATINIDCGSVVAVDYFAMQSSGVDSVQIYSSANGTNYTLEMQYNIANANRASMAILSEKTFRYWRIVVSGNNPDIRAMKLGKALAMQRPIYGGHSPVTLSPIYSVRPTLSEKGQFLGSSVQRKGFSTSYQWGNLTANWYRDNFDAFVKSAPQANPFFIAWRPITHPDEVAYCWSTGNISPKNTGTRDLMEVSLSVEGFANE